MLAVATRQDKIDKHDIAIWAYYARGIRVGLSLIDRVLRHLPFRCLFVMQRV